ncbi:MAG: tRNA epoxyqueuosine(34) reductase QueG [Acidobacteriota bacterium]
MNASGHLSSIIKEKAESLGFASVGFLPVHPLDEREHLGKYFEAGWHADMEWLRKGLEHRLDPSLLFKNARSLVSLAINYFNEEWKPAAPGIHGRMSRYVYGRDYHAVIQSKLKELSLFMEMEGAALAFCYVDDSPILEKKWATLAGIGWRGKNSVVLNSVYGSWLFLAEIITDLELSYTEKEIESRCGECTLCIDLCPTGAIEVPHMVNASKCIAYQTIENDGIVPEEIREDMGNWIYGCDICQEACPENHRAKVTEEPLFLPNEKVLNLTLADILRLDENSFQEVFEGSAIRRGGRKKLQRNACLAAGNLLRNEASAANELLKPLQALVEDEDPILKSHASWALARPF